MLDVAALGMLGAFGAIIVLVYAAARGASTRDSRREQCVARLLSEQLGSSSR